MKLIIGLGNPEPEYSNSRHNVGKDFLNSYTAQLTNGEWKINKYINGEVYLLNDLAILIKPGGYMNEVGSVVASALKYYKVKSDQLMIIYDELDLLAGEYKCSYNKGSRIHNGIRSINNVLGSPEFWHLRIGVRNERIPMSVQKTGVNPGDYVLGKFETADREKILNLFLNTLNPLLNDFLSKK